MFYFEGQFFLFLLSLHKRRREENDKPSVVLTSPAALVSCPAGGGDEVAVASGGLRGSCSLLGAAVPLSETDSRRTFLLPWLRKSDRFLLALYVQFSLLFPHNPPTSVNLLYVLLAESIKIKREVRKDWAGH